MPTPLYFVYEANDQLVCSCLLVVKRQLIAKGVAIWNGIGKKDITKGCSIARKRAHRALKKADADYIMTVEKLEALEKMRLAGYAEPGDNPIKAIAFYPGDLKSDFLTEQEHAMIEERGIQV